MTLESNPLLRLHGITKSFEAVRVLNEVSLSLKKGEVLGLVGENGAGKSTLIKILTGLYNRDAGIIELEGEEVAIHRPADAEALGVRVIHQERHLAGRLTVAEQLYLGSAEARTVWRQRAALQQRATQDIKCCTGQEVDGAAFVDELTVAQQQLIQITRAVLAKPKLLILDEPTAPLASGEVEQLFATIRHLRDTGVGIIFISHYLQELKQVTDRITVLRNGRNAGEASFAAGDRIEDVVEMMVGSQVAEFDHGRAPRRPSASRPALALHDIRVPGQLDGISLEVRPGEVVAVTGLVGSGLEVLADAATGNLPVRGNLELHGRKVLSPADFTVRGGGYVPADRRRNGIFGRNTVRENIAAASLRVLGRKGGFTSIPRERQLAGELVRKLDIRPANTDAVASGLSGGNQQKVVLAKWLAKGSNVLVLDQPTSGVDVGSRAQIYRRIGELVDDGAAVLVATVDLEELVGIADRILILFRGGIIAELSGAEVTTDRILHLAATGPERSNQTQEASA